MHGPQTPSSLNMLPELPMLQAREHRLSKGGAHSLGAHRDVQGLSPGRKAEREKGRQAGPGMGETLEQARAKI